MVYVEVCDGKTSLKAEFLTGNKILCGREMFNWNTQKQGGRKGFGQESMSGYKTPDQGCMLNTETCHGKEMNFVGEKWR